jgi:hypothetical protein
MLNEINDGEFSTYFVVDRKVKDEYTARKVQKDRRKLQIWLDKLLEDRHVIIFYKDGREEKMFVGSKKEMFGELPTVPMNIDIINNKVKLQNYYCTCFEVPSRAPVAVHVDSVTKFIVRQDGLSELSARTRFI